jgi:pimeloyl-ACP methyl ester carboxylesterase
MGEELRCRLADGRDLGYAQYGDPEGTPIFFLHGFPGSRLSAQIAHEPALSLGVRVVAPERPGIGLSSPRPGRKLLEHAADVAELADRLRLDRFAVLGDSGGGPYAAACAFALRGRLASVAIVNGLGPPETPEATRGMAIGERLAYIFGRRAPRFSGWFLARFAAWARGHRRAFLRLVRTQLAEPDRRMLAQGALARLFVDDFLEAFRQGWVWVAEELALLTRPWGFRLEEIRVPVRLFVGGLDRTVPAAAMRHVAAAIPGCALTCYEDEGHFSLLANRLDEILAELQAAIRAAPP